MEQKNRTLKLCKPIERKGFLRTTVIELVQLRAPTVRDMLGLDFTGTNLVASSAELIHRVSNLTKEQVLELEISDFSALSELVCGMTAGKKREG